MLSLNALAQDSTASSSYKAYKEKLKAEAKKATPKKANESISENVVYLTNVIDLDAQFEEVKKERCNTTQAVEQRKLNDPSYVKYVEKLAKDYKTQGASKVASIPCSAGNSVIIPVAIHFNNAYNTSNIACIEAAINAQIASLNADFAAENSDITKYGDILETCSPNAECAASDGACITFCVADQNHPAGSGLNDGDMAYTIGVFNNGGFEAGGSGAGAAWAGYLNMFVIDGLGYGVADGIPGTVNGDGVTQDGSFFGGPGFTACSSGGLLNDDAAWNRGRTMTHEVGHYLGLYHTFEGSCSDEPQSPYPVTDTPAQSGPSGGCPAFTCGSLTTGCTAGEYLQYNYMDYFDDACLVMFSQEQAAAMNTFANSASWAANKVSCTLPTYNPIAVCSFRAAFDPADGTPITICTDNGTAIQFTDASSSTATSWTWTFSVTGTATVDLATSNAQSPVINVTSGNGTSGTLNVTLVSSDGTTTETTTSTYPLTVLSGADCPDDCAYTLTLNDTFGDGWNGGSIDVTTSTGTTNYTHTDFGQFLTPTTESITISLLDGDNVSIVYNAGGFDGEVSYSFTDPFGSVVFTDGTNPTGGSFTASCAQPTCTDGIQNGGETGIDCGGTCSPCPVCNSSFLDSGGASGNYSNNESATYTLCPDDPACELIQVEFTSVTIEGATGAGTQDGCWDFLSIYDGNGTATVIAQTLCTGSSVAASELAPGTVFTSTAADGCLTITFSSDGTVAQAGWAATVTCIDNGACNGAEYCNNICFAEYNPNPGPTDIANATLCVTPLGCAAEPSCLTNQPCDDNNPCTVGEVQFIAPNGDVCGCISDQLLVPACNDPAASNYDANAVCIDNTTCIFNVTLSLSDPCDCSTATDVAGITIAQETLTITPGLAPYTVTTQNNIYDAAGNLLTTAQVQALVSAATPNADGNTEVTFWVLADGATLFDITITDANGTNASQVGSPCSPCETIPTLSEWGLITLALTLMSYGTIAMAGVGSFAGTNNVNTPVGFQLPVNAAILRKAFMFTAILALIGYTMSIVLFGAIFFSDIIGVAIAGPVFAYLTHLLYLAEKNK